VCSSDLIDSIAYISQRESSKIDYGWNINDYLDKSFFSNDIIQIKNDKKYYLIDFWGSWCSPCINEFPNIIDLQNNNPSLEIVSIACERSINDFSKSKIILEEKNIKWNSRFQILDDPKSLQRKLNVRTFPTTFLIDRTGRILSRVSGSGSITRLKKQFNLN
jgi:thiol-disulfide isomerase/thioredoxin